MTQDESGVGHSAETKQISEKEKFDLNEPETIPQTKPQTEPPAANGEETNCLPGGASAHGCSADRGPQRGLRGGSTGLGDWHELTALPELGASQRPREGTLKRIVEEAGRMLTIRFLSLGMPGGYGPASWLGWAIGLCLGRGLGVLACG